MPHYGHYLLDREMEPPKEIDMDEQCTPARCAKAALLDGSVLCSHINCRERRVCPECAVKVGEEMYCRAHAVCGMCEGCERFVNGQGWRRNPAIDACSECGTLVCSEHADKSPGRRLCVDCASERVCPDCECFPCRCGQAIEPEGEDVPRPWHA